MVSHWFRTGLALVLLVSVASAAGCIDNVSDLIAKNAGGYIGVAFILMTLVVAFAYMAGSALSKPEYTVFAKDELFHLGVSGVMFVLLGAVVYLACNTSSFFLGSAVSSTQGGSLETCTLDFQADGDMQEMALCSLNKVEGEARSALSASIKQEISQQMWSSWTFTLYLPLMGGTTTPANAYKRAASMEYGMIYNFFLSPSLVSISTQKLILKMLSEMSLSFFLPAGFFFRIFPPLRQVGNILIAFGIGAYVLLPMVYGFNASLYNVVFKDCSEYSTVIDDFVQGGCDSPTSFWNVAKLVPQAFFLPNLTLAIFITYLAAANKALRVIG